MDWKTIMDLIIAIGLPATMQIVKNWTTGVPVTEDKLNELAALTSRDAVNRMTAVLTANGIDPASPQGQAFIALVK